MEVEGEEKVQRTDLWASGSVFSQSVLPRIQTGLSNRKAGSLRVLCTALDSLQSFLQLFTDASAWPLEQAGQGLCLPEVGWEWSRRVRPSPASLLCVGADAPSPGQLLPSFRSVSPLFPSAIKTSFL